MTDIDVFVLNHHTRSPSFIVNQLKDANIPHKVCTDFSNHNANRKTRWLGVATNYMRILRIESVNEWRLIIHDDIAFRPDLKDAVGHVLDFAPKGTIVSFYNPSNSKYSLAFKAKKPVFRTYGNFWTQCMAIHRDYIPGFLAWVDAYTVPGVLPEDRLMSTYNSVYDKFAYAVVPGYAQHAGYNKSTMGIPGIIANRHPRYSTTYDPTTDFRSIDWKEAFANPYCEDKKYIFDTGKPLA